MQERKKKTSAEFKSTCLIQYPLPHLSFFFLKIISKYLDKFFRMIVYKLISILNKEKHFWIQYSKGEKKKEQKQKIADFSGQIL